MTMLDEQPPPHSDADAPPDDQPGGPSRNGHRAPRAPARHHATLLPHSVEAEEAVLGSMLLQPTAVDAALGVGLTADHYYQPTHGHIHQAIVAVHLRGDRPDPVSVMDQLRRNGLAERISGSATLVAFQVAGSPSSAATYAREIVDLAAARNLVHAADEMRTLALAADPGALDRARELLDRAAATRPLTHTSWLPVDLTQVLAGGWSPPQPTMLARSDGLRLLYPAMLHVVAAAPEAGKTWFSLAACVERILAGEHVLYVDFEADVATITNRVLTLGLAPHLVAEQFHYVRPFDPINDAARLAITTICQAYSPTLAIVDGVTEAYAQNGWEVNSNDDAAQFYERLPRVLQRTGAAVLIVDHVVKDAEKRDGRALGAQHKGAGVDVTYELAFADPFGVGMVGRSTLRCTKDRHGQIRPHCVDGRLVGSFVLDSRSETVAARIEPAATDPASSTGPTKCIEAVYDYLQEHRGGHSVNHIVNGVRETGHRYRREVVINALARLVQEGKVSRRLQGRTAFHEITTDPPNPTLRGEEDW